MMRKSARLAYSFLFLLSLVLAWVMRDFAKPLIEKIPWIMRHAVDMEPSDKWFGQQAVYRVSLGSFLFFGCMSLALCGVRYKSDKRDQMLHHGNWMLKLGLWIIFIALPFFFPNNIVYGYAWLARFGSGVFLIIQMIILLDFTQSWNEAWVQNGEEDERWLYGLLGITISAFMGTLAVAGVLFYFFKPGGAGSCSLNVSLITLTLLVCVVFSLLSLHPMARSGSLFPSAIISLYCMYLCYSALQSEPHTYQCNGLGKRINAASGSTLAIGMFVTLLSVVYSAFRAGSNTKLFTLDDDEDIAHAAQPLLAKDEEAALTSAGLDGEGTSPETQLMKEPEKKAMADFAPITYNYSFFHLIFALASMYIAMLMTGWGAVEQEKDRIDVGWTSVWVKVSAQWATALLYTWTLVAPVLLPGREF